MSTNRSVLLIALILMVIGTQPVTAGYEVRINVNYPHNVVYAGYLNDVEIWIENTTPLYMIRLPFYHSLNFGDVAWYIPYGSVPSSTPFVAIDDVPSAAVWDSPQGWQCNIPQLPGLTDIWGLAVSSENAMPEHSQLTRILSLKLDATNLSIGDGPFCVDDIFIPPVSRLEFNDGTATFRPLFHECPGCDPLLPAVCFDIVAPTWVKGDANGDGKANISDCVFLIRYIFLDGEAPSPFQAGDVDCTGEITVSDVVKMINYIYSGGTSPC